MPFEGEPKVELTAAGERVLSDILSIGAEREIALGKRLRVPTPDVNSLYALCELLARSPGEEDLQQFLEKNPGFITGLLGGPDNADLAVLMKPPIGSGFRADFCVLQAHQGGAVAHLVEIESSHERLFTKEGRPSKRLSGAMTQIEDWRIWIDRSRHHYARELIEFSKTLPPFHTFRVGDRGFILETPERVQTIWRMFGGDEDPVFSFVIIIGRWSQLTNSEKIRILNRNRQPSLNLRIYTYEQVARSANYRLERDDWFNEADDWGLQEAPL
jgi:hypothetical protein